MGTVLIRLAEHLRMAHRAKPPGPATAAPPDRHRGSAPAAAAEPRGAAAGRRGGARGRDVRRAARRDPRLRRGAHHRRADPGPPRPGRHQEHRGEDHPPAARGRRPGRGGRDDEHDQAPRTGSWSRSSPARRRCSPTAWTTRCWRGCPTAPAGKRPARRRSPRPRPAWSGRAAPPAAPTASGGPARCGTCASPSAPSRSIRRIRLWAELSVLAHLTGWPMPVPRTALLSLLQMMPSRLRDCAISHGVDAAVGVRVPVIAGRVSPVGLAAHVATAIRSRLSRGHLAVPAGGAQVARPRLPVDARPGRAQVG